MKVLGGISVTGGHFCLSIKKIKKIFRKRPEAVSAIHATFCFIFTHWLQRGAAVVFGSTSGAPLLDLEAVIPKGKTGYFHGFASALTGLRALLAVCGGVGGGGDMCICWSLFFWI